MKTTEEPSESSRPNDVDRHAYEAMPEQPSPLHTHRKDTVPAKIESLVQEIHSGKTRQDDEQVQLRIWDFAGQDVFYTTHQIFLTWRAVYIIAFDLSRDLDSVIPPESRDDFYEQAKDHSKSELTCLQFINFWLCSIFAYAKTPSSVEKIKVSSKTSRQTPPIFIVGTHRESVKGDAVQKQKKIDEVFNKIRKDIKGRPFEFHVIPEYYAIENNLQDADEKLVELRRHIEAVSKEEPYMGEEIPLKWLQFEEMLASGHQNCGTLDETKDLTRPVGIDTEEGLMTMLKFYHDLGHIVYFGEEKSESLLKDIVIFNPQWLIDVFKQVITVQDREKGDGIEKELGDAWNSLEREGILEDRLIEHMWQGFKEQKDALVELMEKFDLICEVPAIQNEESCRREDEREIPSGSNAGSTKRRYYVPSRFTPSCVVSDSNEITSPLYIYVDFKGFLPEGLFHRLMVQAVRWMHKRKGYRVILYYRRISLMPDDDHKVLFDMLDPHAATIKVTIFRLMNVFGVHKDGGDADRIQHNPSVAKEVMTFLKDTLLILKERWAKRIDYDICFPCMECNDLIPFKDLERGDVKCHLLRHNISATFEMSKYGIDSTGTESNGQSTRLTSNIKSTSPFQSPIEPTPLALTHLSSYTKTSVGTKQSNLTQTSGQTELSSQNQPPRYNLRSRRTNTYSMNEQSINKRQSRQTKTSSLDETPSKMRRSRSNETSSLTPACNLRSRQTQPSSPIHILPCRKTDINRLTNQPSKIIRSTKTTKTTPSILTQPRAYNLRTRQTISSRLTENPSLSHQSWKAETTSLIQTASSKTRPSKNAETSSLAQHPPSKTRRSRKAETSRLTQQPPRKTRQSRKAEISSLTKPSSYKLRPRKTKPSIPSQLSCKIRLSRSSLTQPPSYNLRSREPKLSSQTEPLSHDEQSVDHIAPVNLNKHIFRERGENRFSSSGGSLHLKRCNITLTIPENALPEGHEEEISIEAIEKVPDNIAENDVLVALTCRCKRSSNLDRFLEPLTFKMPHCGMWTDSKDVKAVLYASKDGVTVSRTPLTAEGIPSCIIHEEFLMLTIDHFSEVNVLLNGIKSKNMGFACFLPTTYTNMPILRVFAYDRRSDTNGAEFERIKREEKGTGFTNVSSELPFHFQTDDEGGDLEIKCKQSDKDNLLHERKFPKRIIMQQYKHAYFVELDLNKHGENMLMKVLLHQEVDLDIDCLFRPKYHMSGSRSQVKGGSSRPEEGLTETFIHDIVAMIPLGSYFRLSNELGTDFNEAESVLEKGNKDYTLAMTRVLMKWINAHGKKAEQRKELRSIFGDVDLKVIVDKFDELQ